MNSTIKSRSASQKSARTRARKKNPLRAAKLVAKREVPAATDWETLRPLILAKSDGCYLCGLLLTLDTLTVDHVVVRPRGCKKNDDISNLMPACFPCNHFKGSRRLTGKSCTVCGQQYLVRGLPCMRCEMNKARGYETTVRRTMGTTI